ncbi:MAG: glycosyltransferase [Elusimicrobiota bacterium]|jgi:SAM-dependent methyltransferase
MTSLPVSSADLERDARVRQRWNQLAPRRDHWIHRNRFYYEQLARFMRAMVPEGMSVLEAGCGTGYLLKQLPGRKATGVDFSEELLARARQALPDASFECRNIQYDVLGGSYDYLIVSDVINDLTDLWAALRNLRGVCHDKTRVVFTYFNPAWQVFIPLAKALHLRMPREDENWFASEDLRQLLEINRFEIIREGSGVFFPLYIPLITNFLNRYCSHWPGLRAFSFSRFMIARPAAAPVSDPAQSSCSVVVPCLNERGNIEAIINRVPVMGKNTELLFVDGGSTDGTWELIQEKIRTDQGPLTLRGQQQKGQKGKGQAVREGFDAASGDVLMILDADITVQPEDLPKFFLAIAEGHAEFVNGSRLVYPMQEKSMRFLNALANYFFGKFLSGIISQRLMDTLCGTKALLRQSYQAIKANRSFFGDFDPFGDFDLIFGAARLNLKIVEIPIRYQARTYGTTKIRRFYHGWLLVKMCLYAMKKFR